ncbi:type II secretion system F family protein [Campylobacter volucris]|uniref:Type II secretion system F family protein n=1 Tax=Campylobacter volucris TaxID=1031542 RepID=A0A5C7DR71_9BACT|nr:type II secretion system F family protein [Campylobacter volucris]TXE88428.1 type II secretion system F family protein [Campylobacter volucris]
MKDFIITYISNHKEKQSIIKAKNLYEARIKALQKYNSLVEVKECCIQKNIKIKEEELIFILKDLYMILKAGLSLQEAILEFSQHSYDKKITFIFNEIYQKLKNGSAYEEAFKDLFNLRELAILKICDGKEELNEAFKIIIALKEKQIKNLKQFKKAISYPILVLISIIFAFFVLMFFVLPEFKSLFIQLDLQLPTITKILFFIGDFLASYFWTIFFCLDIFIACMYILYKKSLVFDKILFYIPIFGNIIAYQDKFCFFIIFSYLLKSGIDAKKALKMSNNGIQNKFLKAKISKAIVSFESGLNLAEAFLRINIFETFVIRMINIGLKSSKLDESAYELALFFEQKKEVYIQKIFILLEPLMIIFMALMILVLALGVFLPMWQITQGI